MSSKKAKYTVIISTVILAIAAVLLFFIFTSEPEAQRQGASKKTAMLVDVISVQKGNYSPTIVATGTVQPAQDINLSPRVNGEIIYKSPDFVPGGFVKKGEILLKIDPSDYQNTIKQRESQVMQSEADLELEKGRQEIAQMDFELIGDTLSMQDNNLVLRKPQLKSVQASLESARASLQQAKLDLQRTVIRAPFDAQIITQNANIGSQVAQGNMLGRLVGVDEYWVNVNVPISKVYRIQFPNQAEKGAEVEIRNPSAWPDNVHRTGHVFRQIGALEEQTRLSRVLISVENPLNINSVDKDKPPLIIGSFVEAHIQAKELKNSVRLDRDFLRQDDKVWLMKDGKLNIREADVIFKTSEHVFIQSGINDGDTIVTTNLATVVEGSPLRTDRDIPKNAEKDTMNSQNN